MVENKTATEAEIAQPATGAAHKPQGSPSNGLAIAALVVGIIAFLSGLVPIWGFIAGVAAVILGVIALKKHLNKPMSVIGIVGGAIGALSSFIVGIFWIVALVAVGNTPAVIDALNDAANDQGSISLVSPTPIELTGSGQQASDKFTLEKGLSVFTLTHNGSSNFSVVLMGSDGEYIDLLANDIGDYSGSRAVTIDPAGDYILDVSADGDWKVVITQPRQATAEETTSFSGTGPVATPLFSTKAGLKVFKMTHDGDSNFAVSLLDKNGLPAGLLANEIGAFDGSKAQAVLEGLYLLNVDADGAWTITIE